MHIQDFDVGSNYKIALKDWRTPDGEKIVGKTSINTILEPASKLNTTFGGEEAPEMVVNEWQDFLRVKCLDTSKVYLLHPRTISSAVKLD